MDEYFEDYDVYKLNISIKAVEPIVWRNLMVPDDYDLTDLHHVIQAALEWSGSWDYRFLSGNCELQHHLPLKCVLKRLDDKIRYLYGPNDKWEIVIRLDNCELANATLIYPICMGGAQARPPEKIAGPAGYKEMLEALRNPSDRRHTAFWTWVKQNDSAHYFQTGYRFKKTDVLK